MAATFQPDLGRPLDEVRQNIGDKNLTKARVQDETITALLGKSGATVLSVSYLLARGILAEYASEVTYDVDGQGERASDRVKGYQIVVDDLAELLAAEIKADAGEEQVAALEAYGGGILVGGLSRRSNVAKTEDDDRAANFSPDYSGW